MNHREFLKRTRDLAGRDGVARGLVKPDDEGTMEVSTYRTLT